MRLQGSRHTVVDVAACPGVPKLVSVGVIHSENGTCDKAALQEQHRVAPEGIKLSSCDRVCRLLWVHARLQTQHESLHVTECQLPRSTRFLRMIQVTERVWMKARNKDCREPAPP
jgi:hypothetical protein